MSKKKRVKTLRITHNSDLSDSEVLKVNAFANGILDIFGVDRITIVRTWRRKRKG